MSEPAKRDHAHPLLFLLIMVTLLMAAKAYDKVTTIEKNAPYLLERKP